MSGIKPGNEKIFGAALLTESSRLHSMKNLLTGAAPKAVKDNRNQTEKGAPVVRVTDLQSKAGDEVSVDIFHELTGGMYVGDEKIEGRGESLEKTEFEARINQVRKPVDIGGRMAQKRTSQNLSTVARQLMTNFYRDAMDEKLIYHLAGARGFLIDAKSKIPLQDDPRFAKVMVNDVAAPTYDRHVYAGDATTFDGIDAADLYTMDTVRNLRLRIDESSNPLMPVMYSDDKMSGDQPFLVNFVTPRQWASLQESATTKDFDAAIAQAINRSKDFNHPLFRGDCLMIDNILIRKYYRPVRWLAGQSANISVNDKAATSAPKTAGVAIERAILLGAQALVDCYGTTENGTPFKYWEGAVDHGNGKEASIAWMEGLKKVRFTCADGYKRDHGVMVIDSAVKGL